MAEIKSALELALEKAEQYGRASKEEMELAQHQEQGRRLAVLEERERIGMDLHDGIIQSIYAVGLTLEHVTYDPEPAWAAANEPGRIP